MDASIKFITSKNYHEVSNIQKKPEDPGGRIIVVTEQALLQGGGLQSGVDHIVLLRAGNAGIKMMLQDLLSSTEPRGPTVTELEVVEPTIEECAPVQYYSGQDKCEVGLKLTVLGLQISAHDRCLLVPRKDQGLLR